MILYETIQKKKAKQYQKIFIKKYLKWLMITLFKQNKQKKNSKVFKV